MPSDKVDKAYELTSKYVIRFQVINDLQQFTVLRAEGLGLRSGGYILVTCNGGAAFKSRFSDSFKWNTVVTGK